MVTTCSAPRILLCVNLPSSCAQVQPTALAPLQAGGQELQMPLSPLSQMPSIPETGSGQLDDGGSAFGPHSSGRKR